ncbi:MAG: LysR family transcriptional regulator [Roseitalea porphyridii]|jgi:DNA-binding transcriptional LysR family regulator|uniref:LysR family transcriptional regulator n=1 Tax=Roseitalea porphyridii TaxID=1852022 RepID=A0A4P6V0Y9_9HYPH|nr:LysR family transcriptional regulator [Roseitalea porphyridii]QBK30020.1 LysR family transcriptional regulator [Roseitalea porphyridii]
MPLDWDKLRVFHAAAQAGSFTQAGEKLHISQSAVSRQVSALEADIGAPLFNRHARGLVLTEQGEMLFRTAHDVYLQLENVKARLVDATDRPSGTLRITTTVGLGSGWLTYRVQEFLELYPDIRVQLLLSNEELDLNMRQADCAIRLRQPQQPDLIQRRLFTVHFHVYASPGYIARFGAPTSIDDLDKHRIVTFGEPTPDYLLELNSLLTLGCEPGRQREAVLEINSIMPIKRAVQRGVGIAMLPDYAVERDAGLVRVIEDVALPSFDTYFAYAETMRTSARLQAFRDFLFAKARSWEF